MATGWGSEGRKAFTVDAGTAGQLGGWKAGAGAQVLVLHGGPGLSFNYLEGLTGDTGSGYEVTTYQQRGLAQSSTSCPVDVAQEVDDVSHTVATQPPLGASANNGRSLAQMQYSLEPASFSG